MNVAKFTAKVDLFTRSEIEKARLIAYYQLRTNAVNEFSATVLADWFQRLNLAKPNVSRLKQNLSNSPAFVRAKADNSFRLSAKEIARLDAEFPELVSSEEVESSDIVLPSSLYQVGRGYIEAIGKQINACYENNIFDGCAVLMRRLLEILLIHAYENKGVQSRIQDNDGNYFMLEKIVEDAKISSDLALSRNTKPLLDKFRHLGNFSAHKIYYVCRRQYIDEVITDYRATVEELEYKAGIKK